MGLLKRLALARIYNTPLMIQRRKLEAILVGLSGRVGFIEGPEAEEDTTVEVEAYGPGDPDRRKPYFVNRDGIAVMGIVGPLVARDSGDFWSGGPTTYQEIEGWYMDAVSDPNISGIVLDFDSPGGEATGCFDLANIIYQNRGKKPVFGVANHMAFSAAYALISATDTIYVSQDGGVGSVGVYMLHADQSKWDENKGVKFTYIFAGEDKVLGNPHEPLSEHAYETFKAEVDRMHDKFCSVVAAHRGISADKVKDTRARCFWGAEGLEKGLADKAGTLTDAINDMRALVATRARSTSMASASAVASSPTEETVMDNDKPADVTAAPVETKPEATQPSGQPATGGALIGVSTAGMQSADAAHAAQVRELCALAGHPAKAIEFIAGGKSLKEVATALVALNVKADAENPTNSRVLPEQGTKAESETNNSFIARCEQMGKDMAAANGSQGGR